MNLAHRSVPVRPGSLGARYARGVSLPDGADLFWGVTMKDSREYAEESLRDMVEFPRWYGVCLGCGRDRDGVAAMHVDHVIPSSAGGLNHPVNYQTLCRACNSRKSATWIDFRNAYLCGFEHGYEMAVTHGACDYMGGRKCGVCGRGDDSR